MSTILYIPLSRCQVPGRDIKLVSVGHLPVPLAASDPREQESGFWSLLYQRGTLISSELSAGADVPDL